jgi:hypothetical protein
MHNSIKRSKLIFLLIHICYFLPLTTFAQSLYPVTLDEKIDNSSLIVEGKVIEKKSFWNSKHTMIYTSNKVEVYKIFKGSLGAEIVIEVLTQGGSVDNQHIEASDLLTLEMDNIGIFFCFPNQVNIRSEKTNTLLYDIYSSSQGAIKYNVYSQTAADPFSSYANIESDLYKKLILKTGQNFKNIQPRFSVSSLGKSFSTSRVQAVSVTGFSPATVNAGTLLDPANNLLTITGSGFGNTPSGSSAILFDDANNGIGGTPYTVAYNDPLVVSWSDVQIKVRVPTRAGTGSFQVRDNLGNTGPSPATLQVVYSILTYTFNISGTLYTQYYIALILQTVEQISMLTLQKQLSKGH